VYPVVNGSIGTWDGVFAVGPTASPGHVNIAVDRVARFVNVIRGSTLIATGTIPIPLNAWSVIEGYINIAENPDGVVTIKVNGVTDISFTGDAANNATLSAALFSIGNPSAAGFGATDVCSYQQAYFDDIAINDTTGSVNNSWIGQGGIRPLLVNADGTNTGLTPSTGTDNYALVDEVPASDTDYVSGSTKDVYDLYTVDTSGMPASYTVSAVKWIARARVTEDAANITPVIRSESTTEQQSDIALSTSFTVKELIMETDPIDDAAWTKTKIDALEIGAAVG